MADNSGISWTHHTWNPWYGCDKVDPGCAHCYIHRSLIKLGKEPWGEIYRAKTTWGDPIKWQKNAQAAGHAVRAFTCSLSDFFHVKADPWRDEAWKIIGLTPNITWLILTKRPSLIASRLPADWFDGYPNVWLGTSVCHRAAYKNMDILRSIPCAVRWISAEPLLEDMSDINLGGFGWVVAGGESGSGQEYLWDPEADWHEELKHTAGRRTMKLEWARKMRDITKTAGLPFMFKQVTSANPGVGVNALGRVWHEYPDVSIPWKPQPKIEAKHLYTIEQIAALP